MQIYGLSNIRLIFIYGLSNYRHSHMNKINLQIDLVNWDQGYGAVVTNTGTPKEKAFGALFHLKWELSYTRHL